MPDSRRKFDPEFREGAVRIVRETGKPIAQIARDLGVHPGTLGNWVAKDRAEHEGTQGLSTGDAAELKRQGVAAVFQPGASLEGIVDFIRSSVAA